MPGISEKGHKTWITPAEIKAVKAVDRLVDVQFLGTDRQTYGAMVITPPGNFSMPKVGDRGLILSTGDEREYYIGTYYHGYEDYLTKGKVKDKNTGTEFLGKEVQAGEINFTNLVKRVWLSIANSGDFSLMNGLNEGLRYFRGTRFLRLSGMFIHNLANGSVFKLGSVVRDIPSQGKKVISSDAGPTVPALEALIKLIIEPAKSLLARFHIGHVKNDLGVDEVGSWGARLRAILEIGNPGGVPIAVLKMDESGNIELSAIPPGVIMVDGSPASGVLLGGLGAANSAILGEPFLQWAASHTHLTGVGTSAVPTEPPNPLTVLSNKVKLSQ
jgi:hypothetical protein